jgi:hypothetical protein
MTRGHDQVPREILQERVVSSRGRRNPRGVKRNISRYPQRDRCGFTPSDPAAAASNYLGEQYYDLLRPGGARFARAAP